MKPADSALNRSAKCGVKVVFASQEAALTRLRLIRWEVSQGAFPGGKRPERAYRCGVCGAWHLTCKRLDELGGQGPTSTNEQAQAARVRLEVSYWAERLNRKGGRKRR